MKCSDRPRRAPLALRWASSVFSGSSSTIHDLGYQNLRRPADRSGDRFPGPGRVGVLNGGIRNWYASAYHPGRRRCTFPSTRCGRGSHRAGAGGWQQLLRQPWLAGARHTPQSRLPWTSTPANGTDEGGLVVGADTDRHLLTTPPTATVPDAAARLGAGLSDHLCGGRQAIPCSPVGGNRSNAIYVFALPRSARHTEGRLDRRRGGPVQGVTREHTGFRPTHNAVRADAAPAECSGAFTTGCYSQSRAGRTDLHRCQTEDDRNRHEDHQVEGLHAASFSPLAASSRTTRSASAPRAIPIPTSRVRCARSSPPRRDAGEQQRERREHRRTPPGLATACAVSIVFADPQVGVDLPRPSAPGPADPRSFWPTVRNGEYTEYGDHQLRGPAERAHLAGNADDQNRVRRHPGASGPRRRRPRHAAAVSLVRWLRVFSSAASRRCRPSTPGSAASRPPSG